MVRRSSNLGGIKLLLGVCGGVAAYKAVDLASKSTAAEAQVRTVLTENALQFVGAKSFEAVTRSAVYTSMWQTGEGFEIGHISLADWADMVVVAPATANIIGKFANGICDDFLSTVLCACWAKPIIIAPAMNENMWNNPAAQKNIETLRRMGVELVGPEQGRLACGEEGVGRMAEPNDILNAVGGMAAKLKRKHKRK